MKFGKEFQNEIIPEWRVKYLDYRTGKKKLTAVSRAIRNANRTRGSFSGPSPSGTDKAAKAPVFHLLGSGARPSSDEDGAEEVNPLNPGANLIAEPISIPSRFVDEHSSLRQTEEHGRERGNTTRYGSIVGTPPDDEDTLSRTRSRFAPSLHLPEPAIETTRSAEQSLPQRPVQSSRDESAYSVSRAKNGSLQNEQQRQQATTDRFGNILKTGRSNSSPGHSLSQPKRPLRSRMMSFRFGSQRTFNGIESMPLEAYREVEAKQNDFFEFLDDELKKIDDFYSEKEEEASHRLKILREQLHTMRDRRMEEIVDAGNSKKQSKHSSQPESKAQSGHQKTFNSRDSSDVPWLHALDKAVDKAKVGHVGKTFEAMKDLGTPSGPSPMDMYRDYTKKPASKDVPYRTAKHKLKIALAEYYRGLELLKSYALLNRTAFRKITKKYDKTVKARPTGRYMSEKVFKAYFVKSEVVEGHMQAVEDLYARYFERGNHKLAVGKLRAKVGKAGEYSASTFRVGVLLALGTALGIEGLVYAGETVDGADPGLGLHTQFLLQIYAGYFLIVLIALLFCLACSTWQRSKVNYTFVFEFDTRRQVLDWRQLSQIPSVFFFLLGLISWLNFRKFGGMTMYLYWPLVLVVATVLIMLNPFPVFYPKSRLWFLYTNWRLVFSGIYSVEFRDFFLGDLFCSLTYAMGNIEIFFCLYHQRPIWQNPGSCGSTHSRLLGFFTCLPGIWRAIQCMRRYKDTRNVFPHLVNCGKYFCTITYYLTLSLYRMKQNTSMQALFIVFAGANAIYVSVWDLAMDWSLLDPYAKHRFLRQNLAFKSVYPYYMAILVDPVIRFNWILYAIYTENPKRIVLVSFFVSLTEVCRRGMWMIFRVENEHCANVGRFRAYRDAPLPYEQKDLLPTTLAGHAPELHGEVRPEPLTGGEAVAMEEGVAVPDHHHHDNLTPTAPATGADYRRRPTEASEGGNDVRRRRGQAAVNDSPLAKALVRAGTMMHVAHTQDFERRRMPGVRDGNPEDADNDDDDDDDDDSDNSDTEFEEAAMERARGMSEVPEANGKGR